MKRILLTAGLLAAIACAQAREVFNINRDWAFFSNVEVTSDGATTVNLPHTWNNDVLSGKKDYFRGIGNYQKSVPIPGYWSGKRVFVKFHGANTIANVFVNQKHVGTHRGGYTAFVFEITDFLVFGRDNDFWIVVNNAPQLDVLPTAGDANSYGGIFRDVELIVTEQVAVAPHDHGSGGVYVAQKKIGDKLVEAEAVVKVTGTRDGQAQVNLTVSTPGGEVVAEQQGRVRLSGRTISTVAIPFTIENPTLWNGLDDPFRYRIAVSVSSGSTPADSVIVRTGFRTVEVDPKLGFLLNGKPYPIRGAVVHQDRAMVGTALQPYQVSEDFEQIREMGVNLVRLPMPHAPEFYDLCDRNGILVWSDLPLIGPAYRTDKAFVPTNEFLENGKTQLTEIIRQQYNRPSVVMWGLFSELTSTGDDPSGYVRELNLLARREDPSRPTVASSNQDGEINFITNLICWNHNFGWVAGQPSDIAVWQQQLRDQWSHLRSAVSYSAGASVYHQDDSLYRPPYLGNWHPERWQTYLHEEYFANLQGNGQLWGIVVGNMFDYGAAGRSWGEGNGINDSGLVTFDRKYRKDAYYFYKANWNRDEGFVYIAERRWQTRQRASQDIKVYSNRADVELFVNGVSQGAKTGVNGTFRWAGVTLREGVNRIEARSGTLADRMVLEIINSHSRSVIQ